MTARSRKRFKRNKRPNSHNLVFKMVKQKEDTLNYYNEGTKTIAFLRENAFLRLKEGFYYSAKYSLIVKLIFDEKMFSFFIHKMPFDYVPNSFFDAKDATKESIIYKRTGKATFDVFVLFLKNYISAFENS